jgi:hypothetical protein
MNTIKFKIDAGAEAASFSAVHKGIDLVREGKRPLPSTCPSFQTPQV